MSANIKASTDGTQAIIGVGGVDQMTVSNAGVVTANSFVGNVTGGGTFSGNASNATALATGSTTARTLANRFADVVNVLDFGADPTGATDSTTAFNACPNGMVFIPEGNYKVKGWIPKNDTTYFGTNNTILTLTSHGLPICNIPNGAQNINFSNIKFVGIASSISPAIGMFDTNPVPFENNFNFDLCSFSTFGGTIISGSGLKKAKITNCSFTKSAQVNIPSGTTSYPCIWLSADTYDNQSKDIIVSNCSFRDLYWSAFYALGDEITISNNHFYNTRESTIFINSYAKNISIIGNIFDTTTKQNISASAIEVGGRYCQIIGNTIKNAELYGISLQDASDFSVVGNVINGGDIGIGVISTLPSNPTGYQVKNGTITGNTITNSGYGLWVWRQGSSPQVELCNISGNLITNSTIANFYDVTFSTTHTLAYNTRFKDNTYDDNTVINTLSFQSIGTGNMVLFSIPFRPRIIRFDSVLNNTTAGFSNSTGSVKFANDALGTPFSKCISSTPNGSQVAAGNVINIYNATFSTLKLQVNINNVTFNQTTKLWDVNVNIVTNTGEAVWAIYTATE